MPAGVVAVIVVSLTTLIDVAETPPKVTCVGPVKKLPVIVTTVPPATGPEYTESELTWGGGGTYANSFAGLVGVIPPGVVTTIFAVPGTLAGVVILSSPAVGPLPAITFVAATPPTVTDIDVPNKLSPRRTTDVPPKVEPVAGVTLVTVGCPK